MLAKSTLEIHAKLEGNEAPRGKGKSADFCFLIVQIVALDAVFSLDCVITAIGLANRVSVMVLAIVIAVLVMILSAGTVDRFIDRHPRVKILALSFLLLIGLALVVGGVVVHIPKSSVDFAMGFSVFVELLSTTMARRRTPPITLRRAREFPRHDLSAIFILFRSRVETRYAQLARFSAMSAGSSRCRSSWGKAMVIPAS